MGRSLRVALILVQAIVLVAAVSYSAYSQSTASIEGIITDHNGAVIVGVEVKAVNSEIALTRNTVSDSSGRYQLSALTVGNYRNEVRASGFNTEVIEQLQV